MAAGDLSADQARYASIVAAGTKLDPTVVRSWLGAESGWGVTKPTHNYLNIGPGRHYESVDQAAGAVVDLINNSHYYAGIRAALGLGPQAQVAAIQASPWDAAHYNGDRLATSYGAVAHNTASGILADLPSPGDIVSGVAGAAGDAVSGVAGAAGDALSGVASFFGVPTLDDVRKQVLSVGLGLVFSVAALALIAMGLHRLTGAGVADTFDKVSTVAKFAAV